MNIGLSISEDLDGSQSLNNNASSLRAQALGFQSWYPPRWCHVIDADTGTVIISGNNTFDVLAL
jgi:hypothetical protein